MTVIMDNAFRQRLEQVKKRTSWPVTLLAEKLGKPRRFVYRRIEDESFAVIEDGGPMKVLSDSVIEFFEGRLQKV